MTLVQLFNPFEERRPPCNGRDVIRKARDITEEATHDLAALRNDKRLSQWPELECQGNALLTAGRSP